MFHKSNMIYFRLMKFQKNAAPIIALQQFDFISNLYLAVLPISNNYPQLPNKMCTNFSKISQSPCFLKDYLDSME